MKLAIIDIGTNTFKLMIVKPGENGTIDIIDSKKIAVKLGEGGINSHLITEDAFQRGIQALINLRSQINLHDVEQILAFATSAVRSAENGPEFIRTAEQEAGMEISVISGDKEAELIYYGVRKAIGIGSEKALIMDIGGGSLEFIIADSEKIWWKHSFDLGVARLLDEIKPSDPITNDETARLEEYLSEHLQQLWDAVILHPVTKLIGSSGSFDSLAEMIYYRFNTNENPLMSTHYQFDLEHCKEIFNLVIGSTTNERFTMKGLVAMRVEMMVVSVIMIRLVFGKLNLSEMHVSAYSLKEGILFDHLNAPSENNNLE